MSIEPRILWWCVYRQALFNQCCHARTNCRQVYVTVEEMDDYEGDA